MFAYKHSITSSEDECTEESKYHETLHPVSGGEFEILSDKPWFKFNHSFLVKDSQDANLPQLPSHA